MKERTNEQRVTPITLGKDESGRFIDIVFNDGWLRVPFIEL